MRALLACACPVRTLRVMYRMTLLYWSLPKHPSYTELNLPSYLTLGWFSTCCATHSVSHDDAMCVSYFIFTVSEFLTSNLRENPVLGERIRHGGVAMWQVGLGWQKPAASLPLLLGSWQCGQEVGPAWWATSSRETPPCYGIFNYIKACSICLCCGVWL